MKLAGDKDYLDKQQTYKLFLLIHELASLTDQRIDDPDLLD